MKRAVEQSDRQRVATNLHRESQAHRHLTITPGQRKAITKNLRPAKDRTRESAR